jgi:hypothetical protein
MPVGMLNFASMWFWPMLKLAVHAMPNVRDKAEHVFALLVPHVQFVQERMDKVAQASLIYRLSCLTVTVGCN